MARLLIVIGWPSSPYRLTLMNRATDVVTEALTVYLTLPTVARNAVETFTEHSCPFRCDDIVVVIKVDADCFEVIMGASKIRKDVRVHWSTILLRG